MEEQQAFEDIPELQHEPLVLSRTIAGGDFALDLQRMSNTLIYENFPLVASFTLRCIDEELEQSVQMKQRTLERLRQKYNRRTRNINVVHDIIIDDFEMAIEGNVQLIPDAHAKLMKTTKESNLIQIIIKQFEQNLEGKPIEKEFMNIYKLLRLAQNYKFTRVQFSNESQEVLDEHMIYRIVQVWQVFQQFFKQFDYVDYLQNYYSIKNSTDTKFVLSILRILVEIGPVASL